MKNQMNSKIIAITILLGLSFSACSSIGHFDSGTDTGDKKIVEPSEPKPPPPPKKKNKETTWQCRIMNNEGRTFVALDETSDVAESKARHECEVSYRHCTLLDCNEIDVE
jgi:hypothetical protein